MSKKVHLKERLNSLRHIREKNLFLWVVLENFNSLSRIQKKNSMSKKSPIHEKKEDQFCESYWKKKQFCESHSYFKNTFWES